MDEKHGVFSIENLGLTALKAQRRLWQEITRMRTAEVSEALQTLNRIDERINKLEKEERERREYD